MPAIRHVFIGSIALVAAGFSAPAAPSSPAEPQRQPEPAVRLNTVGFLPGAPKRATVLGASGGEAFEVRDAVTGEMVLNGTITRRDGTGAGEADFTRLDRPGRYVLAVEGHGRSPEFTVDPDAMAAPFAATLDGFYLWRCGEPVSLEHGGHTFAHAACHPDDALLDLVGRPGERIEAGGGWHDAGDYNKYTANTAFSVGLMLAAWEDFGPRIAAFDAQRPEGRRYLDEARVGLEWLLRMQRDDGGAYHKVTTKNFGGFIMPEDEREPRFVTPVSSVSTAALAAATAMAARAYEDVDPAFAERCLQAAERAAAFLAEHSAEIPADQAGTQTGAYASDDADERAWAAAELWRTTGKEQYLQDFESRVLRHAEHRSADGEADTANEAENEFTPAATWADTDPLSLRAYLLAPHDARNERVEDIARSAIRAAAARLLAAGEADADRRPYTGYYWGSNGSVASASLTLRTADELWPAPEHREGAVQAADYLLGRNPFARSMLTGVGHEPPRHPHDRHSGADRVDAPVPGRLIGGPWPGPRDWHDDEGDYRTNEIAINWNASLLYALAWMLPEPERDAAR